MLIIYITIKNIHILHLNDKYFRSSLISARDFQLKTLIKLYRGIYDRSEDDIYKQTNEMINRIYTFHKILKKIELHQKYLNDDNFMNMIKKIIKAIYCNTEKGECEEKGDMRFINKKELT